MDCLRNGLSSMTSERSALRRRWCVALVLLVACVGTCGASDPLAALLEEHGKPSIVEFVLEQRFGEISVERKGAVKSTYGRPNFDFVTPRSLAADAAHLDLDSAAFVESFLGWQAKKTARIDARRASDERISSSRGDRAAAPSRTAPRPAPGSDVPTTADGLGVPESSPPIQFLTSSELEAQDPSYACIRQCERDNAQCNEARPGDPATEIACAEKSNACVDRC